MRRIPPYWIAVVVILGMGVATVAFFPLPGASPPGFYDRSKPR